MSEPSNSLSTSRGAGFYHELVKWTALLFLFGLLCACGTDPYDHYNRRDLYNPEDSWPGEIHPLQPRPLPTPESKPQLRG